MSGLIKPRFVSVSPSSSDQGAPFNTDGEEEEEATGADDDDAADAHDALAHFEMGQKNYYLDAMYGPRHNPTLSRFPRWFDPLQGGGKGQRDHHLALADDENVETFAQLAESLSAHDVVRKR